MKVNTFGVIYTFMSVMNRRIWLILVVLVALASCKKWKDEPAVEDERLNRPYCNDPEAVNYNWDFPGKPDNSICVYPTEIFSGAYRFTDTILSTDYEYDTFYVYDITLEPQSNSKFIMKGFCRNGTGALNFTADRYYRASADSVMFPDSTFMSGQLACRSLDTLSGTIAQDPSNNKNLKINFTVLSDTGAFLHIGTAVKL